jgi:DNA invertase Pin-like site-specific DNA recombinase
MAVRDALIAFMAATAQAQAEATKAAQRAGIDAAKLRAGATKYRGRKPSFTRPQLEQVRDLLATNGTSAIAKATGLTRQTVLRITADPAKAEQLLEAWAM